MILTILLSLSTFLHSLQSIYRSIDDFEAPKLLRHFFTKKGTESTLDYLS